MEPQCAGRYRCGAVRRVQVCAANSGASVADGRCRLRASLQGAARSLQGAGPPLSSCHHTVLCIRSLTRTSTGGVYTWLPKRPLAGHSRGQSLLTAPRCQPVKMQRGPHVPRQDAGAPAEGLWEGPCVKLLSGPTVWVVAWQPGRNPGAGGSRPLLTNAVPACAGSLELPGAARGRARRARHCATRCMYMRYDMRRPRGLAALGQRKRRQK